MGDYKLCLEQRFENWISVQEQDFRDDDCGDSYEEFQNKIKLARNDFNNHPFSWGEELEPYNDISDF